MRTGKLILGALNTNCYIISNEKTNEAAIIDPAAEGTKIVDFIKKNKLKVKYIIITHAHSDHITALDSCKNEFGAKIVINKYDASALNDSLLNLTSRFNELSPKSKADIIVDDGGTLPLGDEDLKFIHTPGHTPGSMCILFEDTLFSGDTLFSESIGCTNLVGGNYDKIIESIQTKLMPLDGNVRVFPGHGEETTIRHERNFNPYI